MGTYSKSSSAQTRAAAADRIRPAAVEAEPVFELEIEPDAMLPAEQISALVVTEKVVELLWAPPNLPPANEIVLTPAGSAASPVLVRVIVVRPTEGESATGAFATKLTHATEEVNEVAIFPWLSEHPVAEKTTGGTTKKPVL